METNQLSINLLSNKEIEQCIYTIRGNQVMLDSDVAYFFGIETKNLNKQMKRNINRFPEDFCFQINSLEFKNLRFQNATSNYGGRRYLPYVYTEEGIIALAGVLKSEIAANMSVEIARKFIQMRKFILENGDILLALAKLQNRQIEFENETNRKFDEILKLINKADLPKQALFCDGQFYDAYEFISAIIKKANHSIILIDPYLDNKALSFLKNKKENVAAYLFSSSKSKITKEEIEIFISQYRDIRINQTETIHDRFLIIDKNECYALGASLNYAGKKTFAINKIEDADIIKSIVNKTGLSDYE